jgi:hypothetical protein
MTRFTKSASIAPNIVTRADEQPVFSPASQSQILIARAQTSQKSITTPVSGIDRKLQLGDIQGQFKANTASYMQNNIAMNSYRWSFIGAYKNKPVSASGWVVYNKPLDFHALIQDPSFLSVRQQIAATQKIPALKPSAKNIWERGVAIIQNKFNTDVKDAKAAGKIIQDKAAQGNFLGALGSAADYASTKLKNSGYFRVSQAGEIIDLGTNLARSAKAIPQLLQQGKQDLRDARDIITGKKTWVKRDSLAGLGSGVGKGGYGFVNGIVDIGTRMVMPGAGHAIVAQTSHTAETWLDETYKTNKGLD